jgi:hypothetical protein
MVRASVELKKGEQKEKLKYILHQWQNERRKITF